MNKKRINVTIAILSCIAIGCVAQVAPHTLTRMPVAPPYQDAVSSMAGAPVPTQVQQGEGTGRPNIPIYAVPLGLGNVQLGMQLKDFLRVRPNVQVGDTFAEGGAVNPDSKNVFLTEFINSEPQHTSQTINYLFSGGTLTKVHLTKYFGGNELVLRTQTFVTDIVGQYGPPTFLKVVKDVFSDRPGIYWWKNNVLIEASYTTQSYRNGTERLGFTSLSIERGSLPELLKKRLFVPLSKQQAEKILLPTQRSLRKALKSAGKDALRDVPVEGTDKQEGETAIEQHVEFKDSAPTWIDSGAQSLLFFTSRKLPTDSATAISVREGLNKICAVNKSGVVTEFLRATRLMYVPSWSPQKSRIAWTAGAEVFVLNMQDGTVGKCNDGHRIVRGMPAWNSTGELLATSGQHSPSDQTDPNYNYDEDIFVSRISEKLTAITAEKSWCVARLSGRDILPTFSSDGEWVFFAHEDVDASGEPMNKWKLYRVKYSTSYRDEDYEQPQVITEDLPTPERISIFPDGKRVLVSYASEGSVPHRLPDIIDVKNRTRHKWLTTGLKDHRLLSNKPLIPSQCAVNPLGTKVAFSALGSSPSGRSAQCIYVCDLDGSNLIRVTPPNQIQVSPHSYFERNAVVDTTKITKYQRNEGEIVSSNDAQRRLEAMRKAP